LFDGPFLAYRGTERHATVYADIPWRGADEEQRRGVAMSMLRSIVDRIFVRVDRHAEVEDAFHPAQRARGKRTPIDTSAQPSRTDTGTEAPLPRPDERSTAALLRAKPLRR
jgi:hypothetical protein